MPAAIAATVDVDPPDKPIIQRVARNTAFMLGAQILIKILAFIFSVYVVRRLGDVHFGRYSAALAYVAVFSILTDLGTSTLSVREMARNKENIAWMVPDIMALRVVLSVVVIAVITLSAKFLGKTPDMVLGIFIASCGLLLYAFQGPLDCLMISQERLDFSSVIQFLNQAVFIVVGTLLLLLGVGYIGLLLASLLGVIAMGVASARVTKRVLGFQFNRVDPRNWWPLLQAGFPFAISGTAGVLSRRFDTVFMSFVLTDAAVGWYNVPFNLVVMMVLLAQSLAVAIYPTLVKEYDSGRGSIKNTVQRSIRYLILLSLPLAIGGTLLADRIILVLYGQEFAPSIAVMRILIWVLPSMFVAEMLGRTSSTMHLERKAARVSVVVSMLSVILNVTLIPLLGVIGAAIAMIITRLVWNVLASIVIGPAMLYKGTVGRLLRVVGAGAVMAAVVWLLGGAAFVNTLDDKLALLLLVGVGAVVYVAASLFLGAISSGETRFLVGVAQRKLHQLNIGICK